MKKIGLICATLLAGLSLSACNNLASQSHKTSSSSSLSTKVVKHHKKANKHAKKSNPKQGSSSSASSNSADQTAAHSNNQQQQTQGFQQSNNGNQGQPTQQSGQQAQQSNSNGLPPASDLHDFVNRYGESPAAYLSEHGGMSPEQAVQSVPNDMKTSGEIQDTYQLQQGQDPFN